MRTCSLLVLLALGAPSAAQTWCGSDTHGLEGRGSRWSAGFRSSTYASIPGPEPPSDPDLAARLSVEWEPPREVGPDCIWFTGRLLVSTGAGELVPVDWTQGVRVLVSRRPDVTLGGPAAMDERDVADANSLAIGDGRFQVGIPRTDLLEILQPGTPFQVGVSLAERTGTTITWRDSDPVVPGSVAVLDSIVRTEFTLQHFQEDWNAIDGVRRAKATYFAVQPLTLLQPPRVAALPPPPLSHEEQAEIAALIDRLADAERPDAGYSASMSGHRFLPVPLIRQWGAGLIMNNHGLAPFEPLRRLEELGPRALPALLAHLDDDRPTQLVIRHEFGTGGMWHERRIGGNPFNERERLALGLELNSNPDGGFEDSVREHTLRVGDLCYVAIGQITGRPGYKAVQYQPTGCIVLGSPVVDSRLCEMVREIWAERDPHQGLLDSLLIDFGTRGGSSYELQAGAATRLCYYFPDEAAGLVASRVRSLDLSDDPLVRSARNGIPVETLLEAVSFSRRLEVQEALLDVLTRTSDADVVRACFYDPPNVIGDPVARKLREIADMLPLEGLGVTGAGYDLLWRALELPSEDARNLFEAYLGAESVERAHSVCIVLQHVAEPPSWARELLEPLLEDRRETTWRYALADPRFRRGPVESEPLRVCDEAAAALAHVADDDTFRLRGTRAELDEQIAELQRRLGNR